MTSFSRSTAGKPRVLQIISHALVFLMLACIVMTITGLIGNLFPGWAADAMAGIALLVGLDRFFMHARMKNLEPHTLNWFLTLGAQWIVIALFGRLLLSFAHGTELSTKDLFTAEYLVTIALAALIWDLAGRFLDLLDVIGLDKTRALAVREDTAIKGTEQVPVHQRLVNLTFGLGILVVILAALTRLDLGTLNPNAATQFSGPEGGALLYFLFGLGLISLSRLLALQTHWTQQRIPVVSVDLQRRWGTYALTFLLLLAVVVSLLPVGDSLGFFAVLSSLIMFLFGAFFFIVQLLLLLITLLLNLPNLLMGRPLAWMNPFDLGPIEPPAPVEPGIPVPGSTLLAFLRSVLLWGSLVVLVFFSIRQFLRGHEGLAARLRRSRIAQLVMLAWRWLTGHVEAFGGNITRVVTDGWNALRTRFERGDAAPRPGWISLRSLDSRGQIQFFYLAMVRRAGEQGVGRTPSQTPAEFAAALERKLPTTHEEIRSLTVGFMEARYSDHKITSDDSTRVKSAWGHVRRTLSRLGRKA
jgi:hypothetical protein